MFLLLSGFVLCQSSEQELEESFRAGQTALKQGDFSRAVDEFNKVLKLEPNLVEAEVDLGLAHQGLYEYDLAVRYLTKALRARPNLTALNVIVGMDYLKLGSPDKGISFLQHALRLDPANKDAHKALAVLYVGQEKFELAAEEYRQIATLNADKPTALFNDEALRGNHDNALKEYQLALQLHPDEPELHEALGEFYLDNHSEEDAVGELQKVLSLDPSRTHALYLLGRLYVQRRENEKAVPYLQRALLVQPNFAEASGYLGTAYVRMGQFADAIPKLEKATALDHYGNVHYQLYVAYRKLGRTELAQKALLRSQELRRSSLERDQALILGSPQVEAEPQ